MRRSLRSATCHAAKVAVSPHKSATESLSLLQICFEAQTSVVSFRETFPWLHIKPSLIAVSGITNFDHPLVHLYISRLLLLPACRLKNMEPANSSPEIKASANTHQHVEVVDDKPTTHVDELPEILRRYTRTELEAMEKSIVRKLDIRTLPILVILFIVNILDRNTIANARLGGLEDELGMSDKQYQTALMVLWGMFRTIKDPELP